MILLLSIIFFLYYLFFKHGIQNHVKFYKLKKSFEHNFVFKIRDKTQMCVLTKRLLINMRKQAQISKTNYKKQNRYQT